jgi:glycosyltransferase involved in cell wall biosynthesis
VSIIVACRNERADIRAFLDSIEAQETGDLEWEAIFADGMSEDGTREFLDSYCAGRPRMRVLANPGRIVSTGLNAAIRAARGEVVLRMDVRSAYAPDYVRQCVATLARTGADNVGGPARTRAEGVRARAIAAAFHSKFSTGGARFHDVNYEGWVDTVPFGCWRRETLERLGGFDESLVRNQDDELNLRLVRAGGRIWQSPAIRCWYTPRATLGALFRQYMQYGFWKVAVIRKHRVPGSWRHLAPIVFLATNAALAVAAGLAAAMGARGWLEAAAAAWPALAGAYAAAVAVASLAAARRAGWATLPYLPVAFVTFHVAYGLGFAAALLGIAAPAFTRVSR